MGEGGAPDVLSEPKIRCYRNLYFYSILFLYYYTTIPPRKQRCPWTQVGEGDAPDVRTDRMGWFDHYDEDRTGARSDGYCMCTALHLYGILSYFLVFTVWNCIRPPERARSIITTQTAQARTHAVLYCTVLYCIALCCIEFDHRHGRVQ